MQNKYLKIFNDNWFKLVVIIFYNYSLKIYLAL